MRREEGAALLVISGEGVLIYMAIAASSMLWLRICARSTSETLDQYKHESKLKGHSRAAYNRGHL